MVNKNNVYELADLPRRISLQLDLAHQDSFIYDYEHWHELHSRLLSFLVFSCILEQTIISTINTII